jgi:hypothetical protein
MPVVKFIECLDLERKPSFLDGHYFIKTGLETFKEPEKAVLNFRMKVSRGFIESILPTRNCEEPEKTLQGKPACCNNRFKIMTKKWSCTRTL